MCAHGMVGEGVCVWMCVERWVVSGGVVVFLGSQVWHCIKVAVRFGEGGGRDVRRVYIYIVVEGDASWGAVPVLSQGRGVCPRSEWSDMNSAVDVRSGSNAQLQLASGVL